MTSAPAGVAPALLSPVGTMKRHQAASRQRGFTMIEMLVVLALMALLMTFAIPSLLTTLRQGKVRGAANEAATLMRLARLEAIKRSCPTLVRILPADGGNPQRLEGIVDCDSNGVQDDGIPPLVGVVLPARVSFLAPPDLAGVASVAGFSPDPNDPAAANVAIFRGDGSVPELGAFRFGDQAGNFLEVRVEPAATARIEVRKCLLCTDADVDDDWKANGDDGKAWKWN